MWAKIFAISLVFTYIVSFNAFQSHSVGSAFMHTFGVQPYIVGCVLGVVQGLMLIGGIKRIAKVAGYVVPMVSLVYLSISLGTVALSWRLIPGVFSLIIDSAFGWVPAISGVAGYTIKSAMAHGIRRGIFSNEAGMGSAPNIAAAAQNDHPVTQGYMQMLGPFFDTIIICTCTAFIVLFSGVFVPGSGVTGIELVQNALISQLGPIGGILVTISLTCFATMTMLGNYTYGEMSLYFIVPGITKCCLSLFRFFAVLVIAIAPICSLDFVMNLSDLTMGIMTSINLTAILLLSSEVRLLLKDYMALGLVDKHPKFAINKYSALSNKVGTGIWGKNSPA